jgi:hypothetical protein
METFSKHSFVQGTLANLPYKPVRKKQLPYAFVDLTKRDIDSMPGLSYGVNTTDGIKVVTVLPDGKETQNTAAKGDIIMSGPSREKYVVKAAKFPKLYTGNIGKDVIPEQTPRMVARYTDAQTITFEAPWGEQMILKTGDYVVREADGKGFYRIAKAEFERTYERIP